MNEQIICPKCECDYCYDDGIQNVCPECAYEWDDNEINAEVVEAQVVDVNGVLLQDGDSVVVIKTLKPKGGGSDIKQGTKIRNIRVIAGADHNIDCKIDGIGAMMLKSEFVKKA